MKPITSLLVKEKQDEGEALPAHFVFGSCHSVCGHASHWVEVMVGLVPGSGTVCHAGCSKPIWPQPGIAELNFGACWCPRRSQGGLMGMVVRWDLKGILHLPGLCTVLGSL